MNRLDTIIQSIMFIDGVEINLPFKEEGELISGSIGVSIGEVHLNFEVQIFAAYPLQFHNSESIRFINKELMEYNHVNGDGSICVHTHHSTELKDKISFDILGLKEWIKKYYIDNHKDAYYEHIVVSGDEKCVFLFTEVEKEFNKGDFGEISYSNLAIGFKGEIKIETFILQDFKIGKTIFKCGWSNNYKSLPKREGLFVFVDHPPVRNGRFIIVSWNELQPFVSQDFLKFFNFYSRGRFQEPHIPLFVGYKIPNDEVHWECVLIPTNSFPNTVRKIPGTKNYVGDFTNQEMHWVQTRNTSYDYFFGRGAFNAKITNSKILIIGIGAVGSNVATTLVRGGCKHIALIDYDVKEPENVCRAEYLFASGVSSKTSELSAHLTEISPFVEVKSSDRFMDLAKIKFADKTWRDTLFQNLGEYDLIFDCSTDNDVAFILNQLDQPQNILTISITNNAKELICTVPPNLYKWMNDISRQLESDGDLYSPNGCWSPTFKASYNDITVLVQFAVKQIAHKLTSDLPLRNFYLSTSLEDGFNIKLTEL